MNYFVFSTVVFAKFKIRSGSYIAVKECKNSNQVYGTSQIVFLFDQPSSYDCKHTALLISGKSNDHHKVKINFGSFNLVMIMLLNNRNNC